MKIIDLLNKIANGEEVPKKIKINGIIFDYQGDDYLYKDKKAKEYWLFSAGYTDKFMWLDSFLNTNVEIIEEEKKIPEKLPNSYYHENDDVIKDMFKCKINEIIDYLESKRE